MKGKKGGETNKRDPPKSAALQLRASLQDISRVGFRIIETAWTFVEPVFDAKSDIRKRWDRGMCLSKYSLLCRLLTSSENWTSDGKIGL